MNLELFSISKIYGAGFSAWMKFYSTKKNPFVLYFVGWTDFRYVVKLQSILFNVFYHDCLHLLKFSSGTWSLMFKLWGENINQIGFSQFRHYILLTKPLGQHVRITWRVRTSSLNQNFQQFLAKMLNSGGSTDIFKTSHLHHRKFTFGTLYY